MPKSTRSLIRPCTIVCLCTLPTPAMALSKEGWDVFLIGYLAAYLVPLVIALARWRRWRRLRAVIALLLAGVFSLILGFSLSRDVGVLVGVFACLAAWAVALLLAGAPSRSEIEPRDERLKDLFRLRPPAP